MWGAADQADLIDPDMPSYVLATKADLSTFGGLFRNGYAEAFNMVGGSNPSLFCCADGAPVTGDSITVGGATYKVVEPKPDGLGFTRLELELA